MHLAFRFSFCFSRFLLAFFIVSVKRQWYGHTAASACLAQAPDFASGDDTIHYIAPSRMFVACDGPNPFILAKPEVLATAN